MLQNCYNFVVKLIQIFFGLMSLHLYIHYIGIQVIISTLFGMAIFGIAYLMKNIIWWKMMFVIIAALLIYMILGALNMVYHIKK